MNPLTPRPNGYRRRWSVVLLLAWGLAATATAQTPVVAYYTSALPDSTHLPDVLRPLWHGAILIRLQTGHRSADDLRRRQRFAEADALLAQHARINAYILEGLRRQLFFAPAFWFDSRDTPRLMRGELNSTLLTPLRPADSTYIIHPRHFLVLDVTPDSPFLTLSNPFNADPEQIGLRRYSGYLGRYDQTLLPHTIHVGYNINKRLVDYTDTYRLRHGLTKSRYKAD